MQIMRFSYYWLDTWVMANVIQLATQDFCTRFLNHNNDPCGRQFDQMTQAARSAPANIAEGNSRHSTSKETEMKLTDVARATLSELANDYLNWLLRHDNCLGQRIRQHTQRWQVRRSTSRTIRMMCCTKAAYTSSSRSIALTNGCCPRTR